MPWTTTSFAEMQIASRVSLVALGGRNAAVLADEAARGVVELLRRDSRAKQPAHVGDRLGDERAGRGHLVDLAWALADDHRPAAATASRASRMSEKTSSIGLLTVDDDLDPGEPVAVDHELGELVVEAKPVADRLRRVVGAALLTRARLEPRRRDLVGHAQQDHRVERLADLVEHRVERLGLRERAREPVEDERVLVGQPLADEVDHEVVGDEVAALEDRANLAAELGAVRDRGAQDVAGRDVRRVVRARDPLRLRALPRPLRAQDQDPHSSSVT